MPTRRSPDLPPVTISEFDGVRYLHLGSPWVQGAMRIARPKRIELDYMQRMLASLLWLPSEDLTDVQARQAVQLGLGAGTLTRFTRNQLRWPTTVVEINPDVISACRAYFHLPEEDFRLRIVNLDAERWLREHAAPGSARLLFVDLYDHEAAAPVLDSADFYAQCRALLAEGGLMSVNLFGRNSSFAATTARIATVFGADQTWSIRPTAEGNTAVIAGRGVIVPARDVLEQRAVAIERLFAADCGLFARKWLRMVRPYEALPGAAKA